MAKKKTEKTKKKPSARIEKATARNVATRKTQPRQPALPGVEDKRIKPLEDYAAAYADIRDQRIALNKEESSLKKDLIKTMKRLGKTIYRHDGVDIRLVEGEDDVKVKIKPQAEDEDADEPSDAEIEAEEQHEADKADDDDIDDEA